MLIEKRREALRICISSQTDDNLVNYRRINNSIKRRIHTIKANSFREFCGTLNLDEDITNIWKRVKGMIDRSSPLITRTDQNNPEIKEIQDTLVKRDIPWTIFTPILDGLAHSINSPFGSEEFRVAVKSFNVRSALGLNSISYKIFKKLSLSLKTEFLKVFNEMFELGEFSDSRNDTFVKFIPMGSGGFRPICLSKLMERIVFARLKILSET